MTLSTKVPSNSLGRIGNLKRISDKSLFSMALGSYGHRIIHQLRLLEGIQTMRESTTYQAILREGRITGEQQLLLRLGTKRFGEPDATTVAAIEAIQDIDRLEALGERILDPGVRDWDDLLRTP